ncbi:hypothetical protein NDU88_001465 [Pleurodeles waltl]|uniref:Uncharacterized protein n=1 Tax=Pleurodeles waltl TaxID=8319 RepID=A0AAV7LYQ1_PLEWA|nr:hypothetical protein NDU88_001465 [Pleurodeles waltl]
MYVVKVYVRARWLPSRQQQKRSPDRTQSRRSEDRDNNATDSNEEQWTPKMPRDTKIQECFRMLAGFPG